MIESPSLAEAPEQAIAYIPLHAARSELKDVFGPAVGELMAELAAQGVAPAGPMFAHYHEMDADGMTFDVAFPVAAPVQPNGRVQTGVRPAAKVARAVYVGNYDGLFGAWSQFGEWIKAKGLAPRGDLWEVYVVGPADNLDPSQWRTELNQPLGE